MATNQHCVCIRVLVHGLFEELGKILLVGRILNDWNAKRVVVAKIARLFKAFAKALDLLNVVDAEFTRIFCPAGTAASLEDQGHEDGPLTVRVNAATGTTLGEGGQEQRRALRRLVARWAAEVDSVPEAGGLGRKGQDINIRGLHELLLNPGWSNVNKVTGGLIATCVSPGDYMTIMCVSNLVKALFTFRGWSILHQCP